MWLQRPKHQRQRKICYTSNTQLQTYVEQKYIHFNIQRYIRNHCVCSLLYEGHTSTLDCPHSQRRGNTTLLQGGILWGQNLRSWPVCLCPTKHFGQRGLDGHIAWNADNPYPLRDTQIRFKSSSIIRWNVLMFTLQKTLQIHKQIFCKCFHTFFERWTMHQAHLQSGHIARFD